MASRAAGDWLVSRQRYFGVPIPTWYRSDANGEPDLRRPDPGCRGHAAGGPELGRPARLRFAGPAESITRLRSVESDLRDVGRLVGDVVWTDADAPLTVDVVLVEASTGN